MPGDTIKIKNGLYEIGGMKGRIGNMQGQMEMAMLSDSIMQTRGLGWSLKKFGPLAIPKHGQKVRMDSTAWKLYHQLVDWEQKRKLTIDSIGIVRLGNEVIKDYVFTHDYYFMAGDNTISSIDSRFWGLVPDDYIVGKVWRIWRSIDSKRNMRWDRVFKEVK